MREKGERPKTWERLKEINGKGENEEMDKESKTSWLI